MAEIAPRSNADSPSACSCVLLITHLLRRCSVAIVESQRGPAAPLPMQEAACHVISSGHYAHELSAWQFGGRANAMTRQLAAGLRIRAAAEAESATRSDVLLLSAQTFSKMQYLANISADSALVGRCARRPHKLLIKTNRGRAVQSDKLPSCSRKIPYRDAGPGALL